MTEYPWGQQCWVNEACHFKEMAVWAPMVPYMMTMINLSYLTK